MSDSHWDEDVLLDEGHLADYTGDDADLRQTFLSVFEENAPGYLAALAKSDQREWKDAAHKLKGAARAIGAWNLALGAERAEQMPAPGLKDHSRESVIEELGERLSKLLKHIRQNS